jgi:hypothetical protein
MNNIEARILLNQVFIMNALAEIINSIDGEYKNDELMNALAIAQEKSLVMLNNLHQT